MSLENSMNDLMSIGEIISDTFRTVIDESKSKTCKHCGKTLYYKHLVIQGKLTTQGFWEECDCEDFKKEIEELEKQEIKRLMQQARLEQIEKLFAKSNLGRRFKDRTFESFKRELNPKAFEIALDYAKNFKSYAEKGLGLIFTGDVGVGKTHLAAAIANYLIQQCIPVIFGTMSGLLQEIKKTYDKDSNISDEAIEDKLKNVELLIIDDMGKENITAWVLEKIYDIINYRYENYKPVVVTTNLTMTELRDKLNTLDNMIGDAVVSRLIEMCKIVKTEGEDYREIMKKRGGVEK